MSRRELDLGRLLQKVGRRIEDEGQVTSQRFHDWQRTAPMPTNDSMRGGGNGGVSFDERLREQREDRQASNLRAEWAKVKVQLESLAVRADWLMDQAKAEHRGIEKHRTPAQVEAEGWCGNHWARIGELVPITCRPTGEPYYRGLCRACGGWPNGLPPAEVLKAWKDGRGVKVRAS